ncbi:MAG: phenylalanine--tRNA ligase subunit beta [Saprospiraceae bacterium]|jgi:phenylalanyl-tRNA synthetase beta chain|nr:phenylalanine--tRNA ligase subunit beta [Saprospiraceae bacterium]
MKLSLNWLKKYLEIPYTPEKIAEMLTLIGLEVEGIEKIESIKGGLAGVVVGKILTCGKHPDADRLTLTTVDIGTEEELQIVCGAPNVSVGQKVMVAKIGTKLYNAKGEFTSIKKGKIRGVESQGMICAEDELGIGTDHSGIIILPDDTPVGMPANEYYEVEDDFVFEVGLTPNRSDATSQLGVARDLMAYLRVNENYTEDILEPNISDFVTQRVANNISVDVKDKVACIRYTGITINNVEVKESPDWLKKSLKSIGVKPINNIVDITNFVLNELGQPLHAFDADKIEGKEVIIKTMDEDSEFVSLDNVTRKLSSEDLMICDGNSKGLCIAGVYGGLGSGVTESTVNVFLESACFNPKSIRRTSTRHNLRTDAAKIFEKGSDPNITVFAVKRAAALIKTLAGGDISDNMVDVYPTPLHQAEIRLYYANVNKLIGLEIPEDAVHSILSAMDMEITPFDDDSILVRIPTNKADVTREVDLIEEIIRIYGLNRIPVSDQIRSTITYTIKPDKHKTKEMLSDYLASVGFNEMMGLSMIESKYYDNLNIVDPVDYVYINNTSNIHLNIMRPDMLVSGLVSLSYNINRQQSNLSLFEFGKSYRKTVDGFDEKEFISLLIAGKKNEESWLSDSKAEKSFFDIKKPVMALLSRAGISGYQISELEPNYRYNYGLSLTKGPMVLAEFGEVKKTICQRMGIKNQVFYGEIVFENILKLAGNEKLQVNDISRFPTMRRDLALIIDKNVKFSDIESIARKVDKKFLKQIALFDVYENEKQMGENKKSYAVSFVFENSQKTLQDVEIDGYMNKLISQLETETGAVIRK